MRVFGHRVSTHCRVCVYALSYLGSHMCKKNASAGLGAKFRSLGSKMLFQNIPDMMELWQMS